MLLSFMINLGICLPHGNVVSGRPDGNSRFSWRIQNFSSTKLSYSSSGLTLKKEKNRKQEGDFGSPGRVMKTTSSCKFCRKKKIELSLPTGHAYYSSPQIKLTNGSCSKYEKGKHKDRQLGKKEHGKSFGESSTVSPRMFWQQVLVLTF